MAAWRHLVLLTCIRWTPQASVTLEVLLGKAWVMLTTKKVSARRLPYPELNIMMYLLVDSVLIDSRALKIKVQIYLQLTTMTFFRGLEMSSVHLILTKTYWAYPLVAIHRRATKVALLSQIIWTRRCHHQICLTLALWETPREICKVAAIS